MASRGDIDFNSVQPQLFEKWLQLELEEVLDKVGNFTKLKSKDCFDEGAFPVVDQGEKYISGFVNDKELIYKGEVPVVIFGDHTRIVKYIDFEFAVGADGTKILKPFNFLNPKFFYYYLKSLKVPSLGYSRHFSVIKSINVPIPSLAEQKCIVAKLDEAFQHLDTLKAKLARIPELLKTFRQAVLTQAVTGKLTEDWRKVNLNLTINIGALEEERNKLQSQDCIRRGKKSYKLKKSVSIELGGRTKGLKELFELPANWEWVSIDQLVWNVSDGPHFSPKYVDKENGLPFLSGRNIYYDKIDFEDAKYVSIEDHTTFIQRGKPEIGDILLTKGGTTGIAHVIKDDIEFSIWVHVALLKVIEKFVVPEYLRDFLTSHYGYIQSQAQTHGVGNQDLGLTRIIYIAVPLPPIEEQKVIVKKVEALFAKADAIEAYYNTLKAKLDKLPQALLAKAFRGELVPQNPEDEPANVLLEKIKAVKAAKIQGQKTKKGKANELELFPVEI